MDKTKEESLDESTKSRRSSSSSTVFSSSTPLIRNFYYQEKLEQTQKQNQELRERLINLEREKVELLKKLVISQGELRQIKQNELEKLIDASKNELNEDSQEWLGLLLETQEDTARKRAKENLEKKLNNEVLQSLLEKKHELAELEKQLQDLQIQEKQFEEKFLETVN